MHEVIGGGLSGAMAALHLAHAGRPVRIWEKSPFPRHKVCGEFLDGKAVELLRDIPLNGTPIHHVRLIWPNAQTAFPLPRPALGISRYRLDAALLNAAQAAGAVLIQDSGQPQPGAVIAHGRKSAQPRGQRTFGYKAHFHGGQNDAVELYFHRTGYTGVNPVEDGLTNVCGLADEQDLRAVGFDGDRWIATQPKLAARLQGLRRTIDWMFTGPLHYGPAAPQPGYLCGDALNFVDPFTGSGMLTALLTGKMAAESILANRTPTEHLHHCRRAVRSAYWWSTLMRRSLRWPITPNLIHLIPGSLLYRLSRAA
jgi:flavin-dependent dehydrogenase